MSKDYYMPESMLKQHSYAKEQLLHALRKRKSLIADVLEKEQLTYKIAGLRETIVNAAWILGKICHNNRELDPDEELKNIKEWFCIMFEEEFRSSLKMADLNPELKEIKAEEPEEETKINVYENMWNTLKETIEAKRYGWTSYNSFLADMKQIERLQKGIPEEDDEEEETEEDE